MPSQSTPDHTERGRKEIPTDFSPTTIAEEQARGNLRTDAPVGGKPDRPAFMPGAGSGSEGEAGTGRHSP